ncbi:MAG TPA: TonB-dependent receptor [Rhizomicrobium sp.]|jgi:outer membrane receptor protein involved in Fe transport
MSGSKSSKFNLASRTLRYAALACTCLVPAALILPAYAQEQSQGVEEVTVTGTRVQRNGYQAPTPLTVIGADQIAQAAPNNLADYVNQMPELAGSATPQTTVTSQSSGTAGLNNMNLRNLGAVRTLVLLDGHRSVGSTQTGLVDVNTFPQQLVSRVDIVTGGASAAYGSDAVAGVVNFVLNKTFTGVKADLSGGISTYGDAAVGEFSGTAGFGFANDRGHILISGNVVHQDSTLSGTRAWNNTGTFVIVNPAYSAANHSVPQWMTVSGAQSDAATYGGIITGGPLKGTTFGPGGTPYQFAYGSITSDPWTVGGNWRANQYNDVNALVPREDRQGIFTRLSYNVTNNANFYLQYSYNNSRDIVPNTYPGYQANLSISADNAYLPASVASQAQTLGVSSFAFGKVWGQLPIATTLNTRNVQRFSVGGDGVFDALGTSWTWDGYLQHGVTHASENLQQANTDKLKLAIDAVRNGSGQIVCRSNLTGGNPGCVPLNPFGTDTASADAVNYVSGIPYRKEIFTEDDASFSITGEPFSNWAGPVSLATGIEHRMEGLNGFVPLAYQSGWLSGNYRPTAGHYSVTEGFIETVVPLAKDVSWAKSLDLNAAVRFTGYSTSGYVTTWKVGATYQVTDDFRVRATQSRDIRAPNLQELFNNGTFGNGFAQDPRNNFANVGAFSLTTGNPNLQPEKADTTGFGIVYQPAFLPGFGFSIDYYNINVQGAISSVTAQQILNQCYVAQQQEFCASVTPNTGPAGGFSQILIQPFNLQSLTARGLDFEANYNVSAHDIVENWGGDFTIRGLATNYLKNFTDTGIPGVPAVNTVGTNSTSGPPHWRYNIVGIYSNDPYTISLTARGVSSGKINNTYIQCTTGCPLATVNNETINDNHLPGAFYLDTNLSYEFMKNEAGVGSVYLNVRNLLNADPAIVPTGPSGFSYITQGTNPYIYDQIGRYFRLGVRFSM